MRQKILFSLAAAVALAAAAVVAVQATSETPAGPAAAGSAAGERLVLSVESLRCGSCEARIREALQARPGVRAVAVDLTAKTVAVEYARGTQDPKALADAVTQLGYPARFAASGTAAAAAPAGAPAPARTGCGGGCCPPG
ncbi:MAG: heavy-metal-associated domain-containing protein [Deferrisomatales bacterium]